MSGTTPSIRRCGEQRRLQHDAHDDDEPEADAADHGVGAAGYLQHLDEGERVEVDDGTELGLARTAGSALRTTVPITRPRG